MKFGTLFQLVFGEYISAILKLNATELYIYFIYAF